LAPSLPLFLVFNPVHTEISHPSFISEALVQIEHGDNPNQDIDLLKDVAGQAYAGVSAHFIFLLSLLG